jgi:phosphate transport system substrate-binding protein
VLASGNAPVKMLKLDGRSPSVATVLDGTWPVIRPLLVLTLGSPQGEAKNFIDFLTSSAGQRIVERVGYIPLPPALGR